jgi:hypothetical protein
VSLSLRRGPYEAASPVCAAIHCTRRACRASTSGSSAPSSARAVAPPGSPATTLASTAAPNASRARKAVSVRRFRARPYETPIAGLSA